MLNRLRLTPLTLIILGIATTPYALANSLNNISSLNQDQFQNLTEDLGAALNYKDMMPAAPLGITGLDIGVTATDTRFGYPGAWQAATGSSSSQAVIPSIQVDKGLPLGFDVGLMYGGVAGSNARVIGGDLSYAIFGGGLIAPALTVRGTYTKMTGVNDMNLSTRSVEFCLSKGFALITPYIGFGRVRTNGSTNDGALAPVALYNNKEYIGADLNLGIINLDIEADRMAGSTSYGANVGWRF